MRSTPEVSRTEALDRNPDLVVASVYERQIEASLERVWENVYDWEHLPWLHSEAFESIEMIASGDWGWHADVVLAGSAKAEIELVADREAGHYVARTLDGAGAPSEIWTSLDPIAPDRTAIRVEFCVRSMPEEALRRLGEGYVSLYTILWSQDEGMMQTREKALADRAGATTAKDDGGRSVPLGPIEAFRERVPVRIEFEGRPFRVVEHEGELIAHSVQCPHLLGPLDECDWREGVLVCPWHGYRFDLASGTSDDGRRLRLRPAPQISVDAATGEVTAHPPRARESAGVRRPA